MSPSTEGRPGIAYRRPDGDPTRLIVEAAGESRLKAEALPRTGWLRAVEPEDRDRLREALDGGDVDVTYRLSADDDNPLSADDDDTWVHERGTRDDGGDVVGYLFHAGDRVEGRRRLERERERLDEFASVVSHDLRNPLSVAVGNIELAREFEGDEAVERLDRAHDALDWMDDLISDLLALAREGRSVEQTAPADLRSVVDRAWRTVDAAGGVALVVDDPLPRVECDQSRLRQALENLFRNAVEHGTAEDALDDPRDPDTGGDGVFRGDSSGEGGTNADADAASLRVHVGRLPDGFYVADDGDGIDASEREDVFDPGHTTETDGTGFGLAIVERIAEAHGWEVSVTESRSGGARFEFTGVDITDPDTAGGDGVTDGSTPPDAGDLGSSGRSESPPGE